jgi:pilus assembly protein CpaB
MDAKKVALLVGALFVAAITAFMAKSMFGVTPPMPVAAAAIAPAPTGPQVLVATKPLPVGTILGPDAVRYQTWPKDMVDGAYYVKGQAGAEPSQLQGMVVRTAIAVGQPLAQGALVSSKDRGFLAAALTPGMRAIAISVTGAPAVAGFVFPGDRVDVVLTQDVNAPTNTGGNSPNGQQIGNGDQLHAASTIVRNIRVLATDQRVDNVPTPDGKTDVKTFQMVTLEATPKIAELIAVAQKLGSLSLSLRPLADSSSDLERSIAAGDIKVPAGTDAKAQKSMVLDLATRPQDGGSSVTTGGEVSRFALNAMPRAAMASGPVIHVARGVTVTETAVGGK